MRASTSGRGLPQPPLWRKLRQLGPGKLMGERAGAGWLKFAGWASVAITAAAMLGMAALAL